MESKKTASQPFEGLYDSMAPDTQRVLDTINSSIERAITDTSKKITALEQKAQTPTETRQPFFAFLVNIANKLGNMLGLTSPSPTLADLKETHESLVKLKNNGGEFSVLARNPQNYPDAHPADLVHILVHIEQKRQGLTSGAHSTGMEAQAPTAERKKTL